MKDIEIAKSLLKEEDLAIAIVKDGKVLFSSREKGIKPMYMAVSELKENLEGSSVADKVIGKAAAKLCIYGKVKELNTYLISERAIEVLKEEDIIFTFEKSTPYIKNRDKTDMCPVEKLSQNIDDTDELLKRISLFLDSIKEGA
ncbi:DUF1893 domain-containing protein [Caldisalinibacter kiritimatiensis]|uniref:DUF1893 domain-containing protein n=1 Tax=Caldisalinibacter kiritimatiensis TaxID=1304284 RepID=R1CDB2_9FIRM|nr:DUF1893 domain-containing protein [Caldisalinibacter kiritimatiensis]EOD00285.1 hypothetical protein L21TH_1659 [Caldisalinibacter kiritimatiensis]